VLRNGRAERFCQQCSRFHSVSEFEGLKRSCRKQLQRHNARRRKRAQDGRPKSESCSACCALSTPQPLSASYSATPCAAPPTPVPSALEALVPMAPDGETVLSVLLQGLMTNPSAAASLRRVLCLDAPPDTAALAAAAPAFAVAHAQVAGAPAPPDAPMSVRVSMKLLRCLPSDLPPTLLSHILAWLESAPSNLDGVIRPGCVFLTVSFTLPAAAARRTLRAGASALVQHLLRLGDTDASALCWRAMSMIVQVGSSICSIMVCLPTAVLQP
jgi:hypothetical protein